MAVVEPIQSGTPVPQEVMVEVFGVIESERHSVCASPRENGETQRTATVPNPPVVRRTTHARPLGDTVFGSEIHEPLAALYSEKLRVHILWTSEHSDGASTVEQLLREMSHLGVLTLEVDEEREHACLVESTSLVRAAV